MLFLPTDHLPCQPQGGHRRQTLRAPPYFPRFFYNAGSTDIIYRGAQSPGLAVGCLRLKAPFRTPAKTRCRFAADGWSGSAGRVGSRRVSVETFVRTVAIDVARPLARPAREPPGGRTAAADQAGQTTGRRGTHPALPEVWRRHHGSGRCQHPRRLDFPHRGRSQLGPLCQPREFRLVAGTVPQQQSQRQPPAQRQHPAAFQPAGELNSIF